MKIDALRNAHPDFFTIADAKAVGVSPQLLKHYLGKGLIERSSHGVYRFPSNFIPGLETLIQEILKAVPHGIVSHKTALRLYGLTEEAPPDLDLLVPDKNVPKRKLENVKLHPVVSRMLRIGVTRLRGIKITTLERTIVDLLRAGESISFVVTVFRDAQARKLKPSIAAIRGLGRLLYAKARTDLFLEALL